MVEEEPPKDKASKGSVRPQVHSSRRASRGNITNLEAVAETIDESNDEEFPSKNSLHGMPHAMLHRVYDDSDSTTKENASTSSDDLRSTTGSSTSKPRVSWTSENEIKYTDQFRSFETDSSISFAENSDKEKSQAAQSDSSFSSNAVSKSSQESLSRDHSGSNAISNMGLLGEFEEPPKNIYDGSKDSKTFSAGSMLSMPSLAEFSALDKLSTHSRGMSRLGESGEDMLVGSSFSSFATGVSSGLSSGVSSTTVPIPMNGKSVERILKEDANVAGTTLEGLAPCFKPQKTNLERWSSDESIKPNSERWSSDESSKKASPIAEESTITSPSRIQEDQPPMIARRRVSDTTSLVAAMTIVDISPDVDRQPRIPRNERQQQNDIHVSPLAATNRVDSLDITALDSVDRPPVVARRRNSDDTNEFLEDDDDCS